MRGIHQNKSHTYRFTVLSPKNPLQANAVEGSLQTEMDKNDDVKNYSGFVQTVLSRIKSLEGGWRTHSESIYRF